MRTCGALSLLGEWLHCERHLRVCPLRDCPTVLALTQREGKLRYCSACGFDGRTSYTVEGFSVAVPPVTSLCSFLPWPRRSADFYFGSGYK